MSEASTWYPGWVGDLQPYRSRPEFESLYRPLAEEVTAALEGAWPEQVRAEYLRRIAALETEASEAILAPLPSDS